MEDHTRWNHRYSPAFRVNTPRRTGRNTNYLTYMNKSQVFNALKKMGVVKVAVRFSGGNDDGGVQYMELLKADGTKVPLEPKYHSCTMYNNGGTRTLYYRAGEVWNAQGTYDLSGFTSEEITETQLYDALGEPVYSRYHTFAGDFYVDGSLIWDVVKETVKMDGEERRGYESFSEAY